MKTEYLTLSDLVAIFKKRIVPILLAALLLGVGGFALRALLPEKYSATASFYVRNLQSEAFLGANGLTSSQLAVVQTLAKDYAALAEESDALYDRMIKNHGLAQSREQLREMLRAETDSTVFTVTATARDKETADAVIAAVEQELPALIGEVAWPNLSFDVVVLLREAAPAARASAHPLLWAALAFAGGLVLSYLFFVFCFLFSNRLTDAAEISRVLSDLPLLEVIPKIEPPADPAEAFFSLRERLPRGTDGTAVTVAVTSAQSGEGKSYVAAELARSLATAGHRVLLIDADLRRGAKEVFFRPEAEPGFAEYLSGKVTKPAALVHETEKQGLLLLPAGVVPVSPCDHPLSCRMAELLAAYCTQYDYILADFPAVIETADAVVCARDFANTVLVAAPFNSGARELRAAVASLRQAGGSLLGTVVNTPPKHKHISKNSVLERSK